MATLESLKNALRQGADEKALSSKQPLSEEQYSVGFEIILRDSGWATYREFIIPQLCQLFFLFFNSGIHVSVLEVGPGPKSVLGYLPSHLRRNVRKYDAFEPNGLFATRLGKWLCNVSDTELPLPCLEDEPNIDRTPFSPQYEEGSETGGERKEQEGKYDIVLFCHSMYGMVPKRKFIERALKMLVEGSEHGRVVVFHRDRALGLDGLISSRVATFPNGRVHVENRNEVLDYFAPFIAGFTVADVDADKAIRAHWREMCGVLGSKEESRPGYLSFRSPTVMMVFTRHAISLPKLLERVPVSGTGAKAIKNRESRLRYPASIVRPNDIEQIQECVRLAIRLGISITVVGGGHASHCLWPATVAIDMGAFDQVHVLMDGGARDDQFGSNPGPLIVAGGGCKTGDIIRKALAAGVTVPLGARPSVGAGLWLQGGIGHLARLHGLACDAVVGAVVVSVDSAKVLCIGCVPVQHRPVGALIPENEPDILWAIKGAGTNIGIVTSIVFRTFPAPSFVVRDWVFSLPDSLELRLRLENFDRMVTDKLPRNQSADAYLYCSNGSLSFGVTLFDSSTTKPTRVAEPPDWCKEWPPAENYQTVDGVGLFETEMYMSGMHGGHGGKRTSAFKRCLFLKNIGEPAVASRLVAAIESRPTPLCYLHLLQGGGAVRDVPAEATAFGCRDWDFVCVITGVWARDQDHTEAAQSAVEWVYKVAGELLPVSSGAYSADLGPDPRDALLAAKAFGGSLWRLARLKRTLDPHNVLAYACPLPKTPRIKSLIVLVTGESCVGKDYCAEVWVSALSRSAPRSLRARAACISDALKREYAEATSADLGRLLRDRAYKDSHRPALTAFFQEYVRRRPWTPEEYFMNVVSDSADVDVLMITGMRDEAPVATFSHLVPDSHLIELNVRASERTRRIHRGSDGSDGNEDKYDDQTKLMNHCPNFTFENNTMEDKAAIAFAERYLLPFLHDDLQRLASMVRLVPNFPRPGIGFRHVLDISQRPGGLGLCASLLQSHYSGDWGKVSAVACCEVGGLVYASALASHVNVPLVLIREAGKLPPPTLSVKKAPSYISSSPGGLEKSVEMERGMISKGDTVVVIDDVLSTGETLYAVLKLLRAAGAGSISIMAVAEFPLHRGRTLLRQRGFGTVNVQSLLVYGGD